MSCVVICLFVQKQKKGPAEPEVDPLDAFMVDLSSTMTDAEKRAVQGLEPEKPAAAPVPMDIEPMVKHELGLGLGLSSGGSGSGKDEKTADGFAVPAAKKPQAGLVAAANFAEKVRDKDATRFFGDEESLSEEEIRLAAEEPSWQEKQICQKKAQKKDVKKVDHSKMNYLPFRKDFYIEAPEIAKMTEEEVSFALLYVFLFLFFVFVSPACVVRYPCVAAFV